MRIIAEAALLGWHKRGKRKPLLIDGARQVGKTYLVERLFGPKYFKHLIKINFMKDPALADIFRSGLSLAILVKNIQLATGQAFDAKKAKRI